MNTHGVISLALRPRRKKRKLKISRLLFILLLATLALNLDSIGRILYPFPYRETVFQQAQANNLNPYLLAAIIKTESNFDPRATSPKGARGMMQLMPETAGWVAQKMGDKEIYLEQLYEPATNIRLGSWYVSDLYREFHGDTILVLAAYNGGRGNVKKWLTQEHWTGEQRTLDQIPFAETRHFVRKVLWNYKVYSYLYKNLDQNMTGGT